jgi:hypothetical protein
MIISEVSRGKSEAEPTAAKRGKILREERRNLGVSE